MKVCLHLNQVEYHLELKDPQLVNQKQELEIQMAALPVVTKLEMPLFDLDLHMISRKNKNGKLSEL